MKKRLLILMIAAFFVTPSWAIIIELGAGSYLGTFVGTPDEAAATRIAQSLSGVRGVSQLNIQPSQSSFRFLVPPGQLANLNSIRQAVQSAAPGISVGNVIEQSVPPNAQTFMPGAYSKPIQPTTLTPSGAYR